MTVGRRLHKNPLFNVSPHARDDVVGYYQLNLARSETRAATCGSNLEGNNASSSLFSSVSSHFLVAYIRDHVAQVVIMMLGIVHIASYPLQKVEVIPHFSANVHGPSDNQAPATS